MTLAPVLLGYGLQAAGALFLVLALWADWRPRALYAAWVAALALTAAGLTVRWGWPP